MDEVRLRTLILRGGIVVEVHGPAGAQEQIDKAMNNLDHSEVVCTFGNQYRLAVVTPTCPACAVPNAVGDAAFDDLLRSAGRHGYDLTPHTVTGG